jgi:transcriptional regulator with XRE-family HTH domain
MDHSEKHNNRQDVQEFLLRLGDRVKELRRSHDMSQEELAEAANLVQHYVSQVEHGERNVSIITVRALARGLGVTMTELMQGLE